MAEFAKKCSNRLSNIVVPLFERGNSWVQGDEVEEEKCVKKVLPKAKEIKGRILELKRGVATSFRPRAWHEVQPWVGEQLVLLMCAPRSTNLSDEGVEKLGLDFKPESLSEEGE